MLGTATIAAVTDGRPPAYAASTAPHVWTADEVDASATHLLGKRGPFRPEVRLVEGHGETLVSKDYRPCWLPYRWTAGLWNLRRERQALQRLAGLEGVPEYRGTPGGWILLQTYFHGRDLGRTPLSRQDDVYFERLIGLVRAIHDRGVLHLDLRQRRNILHGSGKRPAVIDFGAALCVRPGSRLHRRLSRVDLSGVMKYKQRANPGTLEPDELRLLEEVDRRRWWWPFG